MQELTPSSIAPPFGRYSHGVIVPEGRRLVFTSGQLGLAADGTVPDDVGKQAAICFGNIGAILAEVGADQRDVVRINAFVTDRGYMQPYMVARDAWLSGIDRLPASTLMIVAGFTRPEFKVEIEVIAAVGPG
jgi:enamine deaminase RidA (YjgF/YER057c/UK114 family)